jgi:predicted transcriptional regulator YdeE
MDVEVIKRKPMKLAGMSYHGPMKGEGWSKDNPIGQLWTRFIDFWNAKVSLLEGKMINKDTHYEVHVWNKEVFDETGIFHTFVGVEVDDIDGLPVELEGKCLPAKRYAKVTVRGEEIKTWESEWAEVLPEDKYKVAKYDGMEYLIQCYDERFKGLDKMGESEMDILVPIENGDE